MRLDNLQLITPPKRHQLIAIINIIIFHTQDRKSTNQLLSDNDYQIINHVGVRVGLVIMIIKTDEMKVRNDL